MGEERGDSLRELVARLIDNLRGVAIAHIALVKATASAWAGAARVAAVLVIAALLLANAAIIALVAAVGMTLAIWIGPAAGLAVAALLALVSAGLLGALAARRILRMVK